MKEERRIFEMPNIDAAWEKFQQRIRQERIVPLIAEKPGGIGDIETPELLIGKTEDKEISLVVWLDQTEDETFLMLELQAESEKYYGQSVGINLPTATASIGVEEYESLDIEWEKDPPMNIPSVPLAKGKATQTMLGALKKPLSEQLRRHLVEFIQPVELTLPQE